MKVILHREFPFLTQWKQLHADNPSLVLTPALRAVLDSLKDGIFPPQSPALKDIAQSCAVPYDLGGDHAFILLQASDSIAAVYWAGTRDAARRWLEKHPSVQILMLVEGGRREVSVQGGDAELDFELQEASVPLDRDVPLLPRIAGVDWMKEIGHRGLAKKLLSFTKNDADGIAEALEKLEETKEDLATTLWLVFHHLEHGHPSQARVEAQNYFGDRAVIQVQAAAPKTAAAAPEFNPEDVAVLNDLSEEELARLLDPDRFRDWMQFLHPDQKEKVDRNYPHPIVLRGVSGSGKTVVVVHRALRLATNQPDHPVLILTLNPNLAELIQSLVQLLEGDFPRPNLRVLSLAGYCGAYVEALGFDSVMEIWSEYLAMDGTPLKRGAGYRDEWFAPREDWVYRNHFKVFLEQVGDPLRRTISDLSKYLRGKADPVRYLREEVDYVRSLTFNTTQYEGYMSVKREGRAVPFREKQRRQILELVRAWERFQWAQGFFDSATFIQLAWRLIHGGFGLPEAMRFDHVLVDEFQDLSTLEVNFISLIPTGLHNGLFLTGDDAQRISVKELTMTKDGLGQPGYREYILKNYRNTREILEAGQILLKHHGGKSADLEILPPKYSDRHGPKPYLIKAPNLVADAWNLAQSLVAKEGVQPFTVCLLTLNVADLSFQSIMDARPPGVEADVLSGEYMNHPRCFVVSDFQSIKGFEFTNVILVGVEEGLVPSPGTPEAEKWRDALRLYAAMTRARDRVYLLYRRKPSPFLRELKNYLQS